jgi:hypothetical protein
MPLTGVSGSSAIKPSSFRPAISLSSSPSTAPKTAARTDQQAAKDHARVIADCFKLSTVLPFRFGHHLSADDDCPAPLRPLQPAPLPGQRRASPRQGRDAPQSPGRRHLPRQLNPRHDRRPAVPHQPARERQPSAGAPVQGPRALRPDASHVPATRRRDHLQAHGLRQDAARHRPPHRQQDGRALPEQVLLRWSLIQAL